MPSTPLLSVVLSFRNEEDTLPEFIRRTRATLAAAKQDGLIRGWELIFVNDDSLDNSLNVLLEADKGHGDIKILTMSRRFGLTPCVLAGLAYSKKEVAVFMDCDLQDPPELIPELIKAYADQQADVVHTVRRIRLGESKLKLLITWIGYAILNRYSSVPIPREAGDFKLVSRRVIDHLCQFTMEYNPFMRGLVGWVGFKQIFIPYDRQPRFAGETKFHIISKKVISNFLTSALVNFSSVPLQIASYCGLCAILLDIFLLLYVLSQKLTGQSIPGWSALMLVILFIGGVQLFCTGMIGLYLNSVHQQSKMRPNYIVSSSYGFDQPAPPRA